MYLGISSVFSFLEKKSQGKIRFGGMISQENVSVRHSGLNDVCFGIKWQQGRCEGLQFSSLKKIGITGCHFTVIS